MRGRRRRGSISIQRTALSDVQAVGGWIAAFSVTHIGLSAIRESIIVALGNLASSSGLVGSGLELPRIWPGDASGNRLWDSEQQAGRQIFRILYSLVAFATLGGAFAAFASAVTNSVTLLPPPEWSKVPLFTVAVVAQGISLASLANPSPLSLVPAFVGDPSKGPMAVVRDDSLKLRPYGLTRITRHPLILPVIPWAIANGFLAGGRDVDLILFGGLAVYALAGCYAQDLRAQASAAVGTVFAPGDLTEFYASTSFTPFSALLDGRQKLNDCFEEIPWFAVGVSMALSVVLEQKTVELASALM